MLEEVTYYIQLIYVVGCRGIEKYIIKRETRKLSGRGRKRRIKALFPDGTNTSVIVI
jgi:hypothetical protein